MAKERSCGCFPNTEQPSYWLDPHDSRQDVLVCSCEGVRTSKPKGAGVCSLLIKLGDGPPDSQVSRMLSGFRSRCTTTGFMEWMYSRASAICLHHRTASCVQWSGVQLRLVATFKTELVGC